LPERINAQAVIPDGRQAVRDPLAFRQPHALL
jgi:hypothetical protein